MTKKSNLAALRVAGMLLFVVLLLGSVIVLLPHAHRAPGAPASCSSSSFHRRALTLNGFFTVQPNRPRCSCSSAAQGLRGGRPLWWTNPIMTKRKLSLACVAQRDKIKVNDKDGKPVELAAVIMWRVHDSVAGAVRRGPVRAVRAVQSRDRGGVTSPASTRTTRTTNR